MMKGWISYWQPVGEGGEGGVESEERGREREKARRDRESARRETEKHRDGETESARINV